MDRLFARLRELRRRGEAVGLCSVCSAHPLVLEAALRTARRTGAPLLVEATANQVNQHGGYTGLVPDAFAVRLAEMCGAVGVDPALIALGGDHLGPFPWRGSPAATAMGEAETLVRAFVRAGAAKIHLDASMACADDGKTLPPLIAARRTVALCAAAEDEWRATRGRVGHGRGVSEAPVYVIGTEVPVPGGETARAGLAPIPTSAADFRETVETHRRLFHEAGLDDAWNRVIAVVVQPGVEFDALSVHRYERSAADGLTAALGSVPGLFFEAHSTDYQPTAALHALVEDGFAVLKVGPELTFTLREQLFGLEMVEDEVVEGAVRSRLRETVLAAMTADPKSWKGYYPEDERLMYCMTYAYSDRMRYYWDAPKVARAVERLFANLDGVSLPMPLVSQYVPHIPPAADVPLFGPAARELVLRGIEGQIERYLAACGSAALAARG